MLLGTYSTAWFCNNGWVVYSPQYRVAHVYMFIEIMLTNTQIDGNSPQQLQTILALKVRRIRAESRRQLQRPQQAPQQQSRPAPQQQPAPQPAQDYDSFDDDIPF
mgnify:CR=1 FL=1